MSSAITLIVLGQTILLGAPPNATTGGANGIYIPGITQPPFNRNVTKRDDYTYTPGIGGHKVHTEPATWIQALKTCRDEGGHLAVINSGEEADAIVRIIETAGPIANAYNSENLWIGIHDLISQEGDWETIFGDSLADAGFEEWHEAKSTGGAHCGAVFRHGHYGWLSCSRKLGFVCELPDSHSCTPGNGGTQEATWWIRESLRKILAQQ